MRPFWQQLILSLLAPLATAVIGTFLLGLWAAWVTQRWQTRKEDAALRESLIRELLETSSSLYLTLRHYEHITDYPESWRDMSDERKTLDNVYTRTRTAGDAIEYRLVAHFASEDPARKWHSMMDLLTTRYLQLVGSPPDSYLKVMEGPRHTTLSSAELASPERIFERYKEFAQQLPRLILNTPVAR
jgi:DNA-directed RNA polymerase subunit H (RpoH/RPB5)